MCTSRTCTYLHGAHARRLALDWIFRDSSSSTGVLNSTSQSWSCRMVILRLKNNAQAADIFRRTWQRFVRILGVCPFSHAVQFFPCTFENMVALNTAVNLKSLHSQFRRASVRHTPKALRLRHKYSSKSPNLNFANIKIWPFSPFRQI